VLLMWHFWRVLS